MAFTQLALRHVGWQHGRLVVPAAQLTVRTATALQMDHARRRQRHGQFAQLAAQLSQEPAPRAAEAADSVTKLWPLLWSVRCRNGTKEVFWRLAANALPTADRIPTAAPCVCDAADPPQCTRAHIFWHCPMARAVVTAVQQELQAWRQRQQQPAAAAAAAEAPRLRAADIWLARPSPGVFGGVWRLVCLCVVYACDSASRTAYAGQGALGHAGIGRRAVAVFWAQLQHFCQLGMASAAWRQRAAEGPFVRFCRVSDSWVVVRLAGGGL